MSMGFGNLISDTVRETVVRLHIVNLFAMFNYQKVSEHFKLRLNIILI